jgi:hypothetical protein
MSAKDAADRLLIAPSKISRIETAQRNATLRDVRDLCELYGVRDEDVRRHLMDLARGGRERGWWQGGGLSPALESLIGMEGSALAIREIELAIVPGLLQTRDYATAMLDVYIPDPDARAAAVDIRLRRQQLLRGDSPPRLDIVLDEAVLRRIVGDRAIMRGQLTYLETVSEAANIQLRVVPFAAGVHWALLGGFTILDFSAPGELGADASVSSVVYTETYGPEIFIDKQASIQRYLTAFARTHALAMPPDESLRFLRSVVRSM